LAKGKSHPRNEEKRQPRRKWSKDSLRKTRATIKRRVRWGSVTDFEEKKKVSGETNRANDAGAFHGVKVGTPSGGAATTTLESRRAYRERRGGKKRGQLFCTDPKGKIGWRKTFHQEKNWHRGNEKRKDTGLKEKKPESLGSPRRRGRLSSKKRRTLEGGGQRHKKSVEFSCKGRLEGKVKRSRSWCEIRGFFKAEKGAL